VDEAEHKSSGWYPDPANSSIQRWWNGISWGDQTRQSSGAPIPPVVPATAPRVVDPYASATPAPPTTPVSTAPATPATRDGQFRQVNPTGYAGVVLGFISVVFNLFGVLGILAIILSAVGLNRARRLRANGRHVTGGIWCVVGLGLGVAETVAYLVSAFH
jgi:hypothetical protein